MRADNVILGSVLSEKSEGLVSNSKTYTLKVDCEATKNDIRLALKELFGVDAVDVNTNITRGKEQRKGRSKKKAGMVVSRKPNLKKAYVKLKDGQRLPSPFDAS